MIHAKKFVILIAAVAFVFAVASGSKTPAYAADPAPDFHAESGLGTLGNMEKTVQPGTGGAANTRLTYPSAVSVEVLGRGLMWSVNFDQAVNADLAVGIGYGGVKMKTVAGLADVTASIVPVYMNYYFSHTGGAVYETVGVDVSTNSDTIKGRKSNTGDLTFPDSTIVPTFGVGYENRGDNGFLFRVAGYGLVGHTFSPWIGASFGLAF